MAVKTSGLLAARGPHGRRGALSLFGDLRWHDGYCQGLDFP